MRLSVLTYNIRGLPWIACPIKLIMKFINTKQADIICLQEVFTRALCNEVYKEAKKMGYNIFFPPKSCHVPFFANPSGLCILAKREHHVIDTPIFEPFRRNGGLDWFVRKGLFSIRIKNNQKEYDIINTHFQSDITDCTCYRINYPRQRIEQEKQLIRFCQRLKFPLIFGDLNQDQFNFFEQFDPDFHVTFPGTGEHLDHMLYTADYEKLIIDRSIVYYDDCRLSDHIPIQFEFTLSE